MSLYGRLFGVAKVSRTHARFLVSIKSNSREWYPKSVVSNSSTGEGMLVEE